MWSSRKVNRFSQELAVDVFYDGQDYIWKALLWSQNNVSGQAVPFAFGIASQLLLDQPVLEAVKECQEFVLPSHPSFRSVRSKTRLRDQS